MKMASAVVLFLASSMAWPQGEVTFKTETNLVLVPVVVRDAKGNTVGNLGKEDFQLFDKGKPQEITKFAVEDTSTRVAEDRSSPGRDPAQPKAAPVTIPDHYVALLFDDLHLKTGPGNIGDFADLVYSRNAALKFLDTLQPSDRVAIFTPSGEVEMDFTGDRAKLREGLLKIRAASPVSPPGSPCQIQREIENESRALVMTTGNIVRRMSLLPGQRTVVLITSGLELYDQGFCPWSLVPETMQLIDHAVRSHIVINGLDARGLALQSGFSYQMFQAQVTNGTGGRFISDTNDLTGAVRRLSATPEHLYILGFSPQLLKPDGSFHSLTVKLVSRRKFDVQARNGYFAPGGKEQPTKQETPLAVESAELPRVDESQTKDVAATLGLTAAATNPKEVPEATLVTAPAPEPPKAPASPLGEAEVTTRDEPVTFKVQSNLVEVPVIVRDSQGHAIGNLRQEDFRVFDKGKRQEITKFYVQKAAGPAAPDKRAESSRAENGPAGGGQVSGASKGAAAPPVLPTHFVAFVFDDVHIRFEDLPQVRAAAVKYIRTSLQPGDRAALFTTSGRIGVDFTDIPEALIGPLLKITPNPIGAAMFGSCGMYVSYFQAVQIDQQVGMSPSAQDIPKSLALRVAVDDFGDLHTAMQYVRDAYTSGLQETRAALGALKLVVQRIAQMPGQRSVVLASPGFFVPADLQNASSDLIQLAIRSKVLISGVDARGVWTIPTYDACRPGGSANVIQDEVSFRPLENEAETDELIALAEDTGGTLNRDNDFYGGVRKAAATPEYLYVLGFVPQDLKVDGKFHPLKVTTNAGEKVSLQARRGYWAPKRLDDATAASRQEIESAVFSREEIHSLPVEMHTQVTKTGAAQKLNVITSVDLKLIHLRKVDDRNRNDVTIVAAVFDGNGNFVAGQQKILQLRLRDETLRALDQKPPVNIDTNFDVQPGSYLVRLVVRDDEGQQITAENAGVQVP